MLLFPILTFNHNSNIGKRLFFHPGLQLDCNFLHDGQQRSVHLYKTHVKSCQIRLDLIFQSAKVLLQVLRSCVFFSQKILCLVCFVAAILVSSNGGTGCVFGSRRRDEDCGGCGMAEKWSNGQAV